MCDKDSSNEIDFMKDKIHVDGPQKRCLSSAIATKGTNYIYRVLLPGNFNEEYMKIKSMLTPLKQVLGQFCLHNR